MTTSDPRDLVTYWITELSQGNYEPFLEAMHEEVVWSWKGIEPWAHSFVGKEAVVNGLWGSVRTTLKRPYRTKIHRILADGACVVVEMTGLNETVEGIPYPNQYCWVCEVKEGKLFRIHEYMDTALVTQVFGSSS